MTTLEHPRAAERTSEPIARSASDRAAAAIRAPLLQHALLIGVAGDVLLRDVGLSFPIWVSLLALSGVALTWRTGSSVARETAFWLTLAVLFASVLAWRASDMLQFMNTVASLGALGMAAIASGNRTAGLLARRLRDTAWAAAAVVRAVCAGFIPIAWRALDEPGARARGTSRVLPVVRAALIAVAILVVFGSLLRGADPIFASLVTLPDVDVGDVISHVFLIGFFSWLAAGWGRGLLRLDTIVPPAPDTLPFSLGTLDIITALGTLLLVFSAYIFSQLGWFFGGEQFLRERTGLTAATYARQGFFELVAVVTLALPVLMATRAAMRPEPGLARRHTMLSLPVVALLGATILSGAARMRLYVHYYGLTTDRLYPLVFIGWLGVVLAWFAFTVLRGWSRPFVAGALLSGAFVLAAVDVSNPDMIVARVNVSRAAGEPTRIESRADLGYLASLGGAVPYAVREVLADTDVPVTTRDHRCEAARTLLAKWGPESRFAARGERVASWRGWNADASAAFAAVGQQSAALRTVAHQTCPPGTEKQASSDH